MVFPAPSSRTTPAAASWSRMRSASAKFLSWRAWVRAATRVSIAAASGPAAPAGPYAYTRNPMYLGHIIFLVGLTLTLDSFLAAFITIFTAVWFHFRILGDEKKLKEQLGPPYTEYLSRVKRWIPGCF